MKLNLAALLPVALLLTLSGCWWGSRTPLNSQYRLTVSRSGGTYTVGGKIVGQPFKVGFHGQIDWTIINDTDGQLEIKFAGLRCAGSGQPVPNTCALNFVKGGTLFCEASTGRLGPKGTTTSSGYISGIAQDQACSYASTDPKLDDIEYEMIAAVPDHADVRIDPQLQIDRGGEGLNPFVAAALAALAALLAFLVYWFGLRGRPRQGP